IRALRAHREVNVQFIAAADSQWRSLAGIQHIWVKHWRVRSRLRGSVWVDPFARSNKSEAAEHGTHIYLSRSKAEDSILSVIVCAGISHRHEPAPPLHVTELQSLHLRMGERLGIFIDHASGDHATLNQAEDNIA